MEGSMRIQSIVNSCLLIATIAFSSVSNVQRFKAPADIQLHGYICTGDYIWYHISDVEIKSGKFRVGRMHVPSRISEVFDFNDFGMDLTNFFPKKFIAPDSNHCAFLANLGDLAYYNGTVWKNVKNKRIENIANTRSGRIIMNSQDYFGIIENDTVKFISRDSIGLSETLMAVASDSMENIYLASRHKVAKYDGSTWTIVFANDTMNLEWVHVLPDNSVYVQVQVATGGGSYSRKLTGNGPLTYTFYQMDSIQTNVYRVAMDSSGNKWYDIRNSRSEFHMEMINSTDTINGFNALSRGWKNWPEFMHSGNLGFRTSGKHVYIALKNGFYHYGGGPDRSWEWIPLAQTFNTLDTIGANTLFPSSDSSMYIYSLYGAHLFNKYKNGEFYTFPNLAGRNICIDHQGVIWTQIDGYLCKFVDPFFKKVLFLPMGVDQIMEDNHGRIIVLCVESSSLEQQIFRKSNSDWEIFNQSNSNMPVKSIARVVQSSNGTYWLNTFEDGVAKSSDLHTWTYFDSTNSILPHRYIFDMIADSNGNVFVAISGDVVGTVMVYKYNGNAWDTLGVTSAQDGKLNIDHYGKLWFGMTYYDDSGWQTVSATMALNDFKIDYANKLWVATYDKIFITTNDEFYSFSPQTSHVRFKMKENKKQFLSIRTTDGNSALIDFFVDKPSSISLSIFTLQGKQVANLKKGYLEKGAYNAVWKNSGAKGVYIIRYVSQKSIYNVPLRVF
jgi:hypothetical protein